MSSSLTQSDPGTIHLGGPAVLVNDKAVSEAVAPGHILELFNNSGVWRYRKSTATDKAGSIFACEHAMANKGVDDSYAANDLVEAKIGQPGSTFWGWLASGQSVAVGDPLSIVTGGMVKALGSGVVVAFAQETKNNTTGSLAPSTLPTGVAAGAARIRLEVA